jgi:hypothetical protein
LLGVWGGLESTNQRLLPSLSDDRVECWVNWDESLINFLNAIVRLLPSSP